MMVLTAIYAFANLIADYRLVTVLNPRIRVGAALHEVQARSPCRSARRLPASRGHRTDGAGRVAALGHHWR